MLKDYIIMAKPNLIFHCSVILLNNHLIIYELLITFVHYIYLHVFLKKNTALFEGHQYIVYFQKYKLNLYLAG